MLALGDALAMVLLEARGFQKEDFAKFHPGRNGWAQFAHAGASGDAAARGAGAGRIGYSDSRRAKAMTSARWRRRGGGRRPEIARVFLPTAISPGIFKTIRK